jgi:hypothetical protein
MIDLTDRKHTTLDRQVNHGFQLILSVENEKYEPEIRCSDRADACGWFCDFLSRIS